MDSTGFVASMKQMLLQRQMYILTVYKYFDPVGDLIKQKLTENDIDFRQVSIPTCLKEYARAPAATSNFIKVGNDTLIFWQTVTNAGRIHKTKELSARFRATKAMWDGKDFCLRPEAQKYFFVADGEWRKEDFDMFMRSGVDGIFYPDEIDELVSQIQPDKGITIDEIELPLAAEPAEPVKIKEAKKQYRIMKGYARCCNRKTNPKNTSTCLPESIQGRSAFRNSSVILSGARNKPPS